MYCGLVPSSPPPPPPVINNQPDPEPPDENVQHGIEILDVDPNSVHIKLIKSIESQNKLDLEPLLFINGKTSDLKEIESLNPETIESISVLKGDSIKTFRLI
jgi:hypothetical protein